MKKKKNCLLNFEINRHNVFEKKNEQLYFEKSLNKLVVGVVKWIAIF